jgi:hypothetical protein
LTLVNFRRQLRERGLVGEEDKENGWETRPHPSNKRLDLEQERRSEKAAREEAERARRERERVERERERVERERRERDES